MKRDQIMYFRVTEREKKAITLAAKVDKRTVSDYIRMNNLNVTRVKFWLKEEI